jgi:4-aminobutyrate aminotransferase-like enzyme
VLRISPALNVTTQDADQAADILDQALLAGGRA